MRALLIAAALLALPVLVPSAAAAAPPQVTVVALQFLPPALAVAAGTPILFASLEPVSHHIIAGTDGSEWGHLYPHGSPEGDTFTHVVNAPSGATVLYFCTIHPLMRGVVVVT